AANPLSLAALDGHPRYRLWQCDVADGAAVQAALAACRPEAVLHLAAESHVDRSLEAPLAFVHSNITGTATLLAATLAYWQALPAPARECFRFIHVSTDEVYGELAAGAAPCMEGAAYAPGSPYAASKAAADHLARAWQRSYGLPVIVTACTNNYGPRQFPEKLLPHLLLRALHGLPLPLYGDGAQTRDWLHVDDHVAALLAVLARGQPGATYHVSAGDERCNREVVHMLCDLLDARVPERRPAGVARFRECIAAVADRPGHDRRYALDASRLRRELGWQPRTAFAEGLAATVQWYLDHAAWWQPLCADGLPRRGLPSGVSS
ncbi:MAG: dTDP-glucose 4,6-dehydratase, partial [Moraxellaceae bacterium]